MKRASAALLVGGCLGLGSAVMAQSFSGVTTGPLVEDTATSFGSVWFDYDEDGDLDLYVVNLGQPNSLYRNDGATSFTKITSGPLVNGSWQSFGVCLGDYGNDGHVDVHVAQFGQRNRLYRNDGGGNFTTIVDPGIGTDVANSVGSSWADYDGDGDVDLFVANGNGQNDDLYRNDGSGGFTRLLGLPVTSTSAGSHGCSWADHDDDGDVDLIVPTNDSGPNLFFENDAAGNLSQVTVGPIATEASTAVGASWGRIGTPSGC